MLSMNKLESFNVDQLFYYYIIWDVVSCLCQCFHLNVLSVLGSVSLTSLTNCRYLICAEFHVKGNIMIEMSILTFYKSHEYLVKCSSNGEHDIFISVV